jgi:hypothetical protein
VKINENKLYQILGNRYQNPQEFSFNETIENMERIIVILLISCFSTFVFGQEANQHVSEIRKDTAFLNFIRNNRIKSLNDTVSMVYDKEKWNFEMIHHFNDEGMLTSIDGYYFLADTNIISPKVNLGMKLTYNEKGNLTQFHRYALRPNDSVAYDTINSVSIDYSSNTLKYYGFEYRYQAIKKKWSILEFTNHHIDTVSPNAVPGHYQRYFALLLDRFEDSIHLAKLIDSVVVQRQFEWHDIDRYQDFHGSNEKVNFSPLSTPFTIRFLAQGNHKHRFWFADTEESPTLNKPNRFSNDLGADEYLHDCNFGAYTHIFYSVTDTIKNTIIEKRYQFLPDSNGILVLDILKIYDLSKNLQTRYLRNAVRGEHFEHNKNYWIRQDFHYKEGKLSSYTLNGVRSEKQKTNDPIKMKYRQFGDFEIIPCADRFFIIDAIKHQVNIDGIIYRYTNY